MIYLLTEFWPYLLAAFLIGLVTGWFTYQPVPEEDSGKP